MTLVIVSSIQMGNNIGLTPKEHFLGDNDIILLVVINGQLLVISLSINNYYICT